MFMERHLLRPETSATKDWLSLATAVRTFDADVVVLVARKMPRLIEALELTFGPRAICVSDQAIPFVQRELSNARVAIVDDVWNVGTTMKEAKKRVEAAGAKAIGLFAVAAKNAPAALREGVHLTSVTSLTAEDYYDLVEFAPRLLRLVSKPYDADFPIVQCILRAPFSCWSDCWAWLQAKYGERAHSTSDESQLVAGLGRATIDISAKSGWTLKARLYFDFNAQRCNVIPMALAPHLPLANDYPTGSLSSTLFAAFERLLPAESSRDESDVREGLARAQTFCDSVLHTGLIVDAVEGLLQRANVAPFSNNDVFMQFGPAAAAACLECFAREHAPTSSTDLDRFAQGRHAAAPDHANCSLIDEGSIADQAARLLKDGHSTLAFEALFRRLGEVVGADDPAAYSLVWPYSKEQIDNNPYLRLRLGFTYRDLVRFFRQHWNDQHGSARPLDLVVSDLLDCFIDYGAVVPTMCFANNTCTRVYRKGEANPKWDEEITRLRFALKCLSKDDRDSLMQRGGRTRVSKISAILALSGEVPTALRAGSLERGTAGVLSPSVVEKAGGDLTGVMRRLGLWDSIADDPSA
jgi:hypothetical protein